MNCPLCNINLEERKFKNIYGQIETSYQCFQCGGIFFSELSGLRIKEKEAEKLEEINLPLLKTKLPLDINKNFKCPQCNKKMGKYLNPKYKDLLILFCENCKGMFFNHGELLKFTRKKEEEISKLKRKKEENLKEKKLFKKIYETQGKEALIKAIMVIYPDEKELKEKIKREYEKDLSYLFIQEFLGFLIPFSKFPINLIINILLTLLPFLKDTLKKNEETF
ncbi:MAG: zf-TFIIB domain-containing protein [candidate division WOR-3 bacterium]